ncbi:eukaryotic translation initiation factor 5 [Dimargaris verticillata]|uniref:Eukaryotic translation initiation factor 5 n=1 Tax=Dimargaris verticillata TaxID=2761393 RepID=A0A9W8B5Q4_9FUNG|nr:eukaryotic translation initiation factor 5 [Dimargaris verticillata]
MATINIQRDSKDPYYRYKMPKLLGKIEGKGNGIKTVIPNMADIARSLSRPPSYPTKFFGCELGAQVKNEAKNDRYIVNGAHDTEKLQSLLFTFIDKFVLCGACHNPETDLVLKDQTILRDCKACGQRMPVDMRHKLVTFIMKNPPPTFKRSSRKDKASRKQAGGSNSPEDELLAADSDDELTRRIVSEAADLPDASHYDNDDDWAVDDTSEAAIKARQEQLALDMGKLAVNGDGDDDADGGQSKYDEFGDFLTKDPSASMADIEAKAQELGVWGKHRALEVLIQALFDADVINQLKKFRPLLLKFGQTEKHQRSILGGLERLIGVNYPEVLLDNVPNIFITVYNLDLVDEAVFMKWAEKASRRYVDRETSRTLRDKAAPFIKWLQDAEEETDSEEEDDSE